MSEILNILKTNKIPHIKSFTCYKTNLVEQTLSKDENEFNECGYRSDSFLNTSGINVLSIGCSDVWGAFLNKEDRFSNLFCKYLSEKTNQKINNFNLGLPGKSNDYIARSIITLSDLLNPKYVLVCFTRLLRREFFDENGKCYDFLWDHGSFQNIFYYESHNILSNKNNNILNFYKNYKLIEDYLKNKNVELLFTLSLDSKGERYGLDEVLEIIDLTKYVGYFERLDNSDRHHPGVKSNYALYEKFIKKIRRIY